MRLNENGMISGLPLCVCVFGVENFIFIQYKMLLESLNSVSDFRGKRIL